MVARSCLASSMVKGIIDPTVLRQE